MEENDESELPKNPFVAIAAVCGGFSFGIVAVPIALFNHISDAGMWAIAAAAMAPALMGTAICYFISKQR